MFESLERRIGIKFKDKNLLKESLTHRSYINENKKWSYSHNERLEFLGDAVLELCVSEFLFKNFTDIPEGDLTGVRAKIVRAESLASAAQKLDLPKFVFLSKGEATGLDRAKKEIWGNALEALIGAIYLDQGFKKVFDFVLKNIIPSNIKEIIYLKEYKDSKSLLQEITQAEQGITPTYKTLEEWGPDHHRQFRIGVFVGDDMIAEGVGFSKQEAESSAGQAALEKLGIKLE